MAKTLAASLCAVAIGAVATDVAVASQTAGRSATSRWICPAQFSPLPHGWIQGNLGLNPTITTTDTWAHTRGFANLTDITRDGIYVEVLLSARYPTSPAPSARLLLDLPLDIRHSDQITTAEGPLPEYRFAGRYHGLYVDIRIDFGRTNPPATIRRRAQPLLNALYLPSGPVTTPAACK